MLDDFFVSPKSSNSFQYLFRNERAHRYLSRHIGLLAIKSYANVKRRGNNSHFWAQAKASAWESSNEAQRTKQSETFNH